MVQDISCARGKSREDPSPHQQSGTHAGCSIFRDTSRNWRSCVEWVFRFHTSCFISSAEGLALKITIISPWTTYRPAYFNMHAQNIPCAPSLCITFGCSVTHRTPFSNYQTSRGCLVSIPAVFLTKLSQYSVLNAEKSVGPSKI